MRWMRFCGGGWAAAAGGGVGEGVAAKVEAGDCCWNCGCAAGCTAGCACACGGWCSSSARIRPDDASAIDARPTVGAFTLGARMGPVADGGVLAGDCGFGAALAKLADITMGVGGGACEEAGATMFTAVGGVWLIERSGA